MSTAVAAQSAVENLVMNITNEIHVRASLEKTFESLLEQLGTGADTPEGKAMPNQCPPDAVVGRLLVRSCDCFRWRFGSGHNRSAAMLQHGAVECRQFLLHHL